MSETEWFEGKDREIPHRRMILLPWLIWALVIGLSIGGSLYVSKVMAEEIPVYVYERDGLSLRLMPGPCVDPVSSFIVVQGLPRYASRFRAIESVWSMQDGTKKPFAGCWAELTAEEAQEAAFILVFEDRSRYVVSKKDLVGKPGGV